MGLYDGTQEIRDNGMNEFREKSHKLIEQIYHDSQFVGSLEACEAIHTLMEGAQIIHAVLHLEHETIREQELGRN